MKQLWLLLTLCVLTQAGHAQGLPYQTPPQAIAALAEAPATPHVSVSPNGRWMLLEDVEELPPIAELAQPELRLAGLRLNPRTNGPSRVRYLTQLRLRQLPEGKELLVQGLPRNARISEVKWSPDNSKIAFTHAAANHLELWLIDVAGVSARLVPNLYLNGTFGSSYEWVSDSKTLIARAVVGGRGDAPDPTATPSGPIIQDNQGETTPARTYQDLLKNPADERLFDYYGLTQTVKVSLDGRMQPLGDPGLIEQAVPSPNGRFVLLKVRHRPYSYTLPVSSFPLRVQVLNMEGLVVKELAELPLADHVSTSFDAVPATPRAHGWREDAPATVYWVTAQDGGDPKTAAPVRDKLFTWAAPFEGTPQELAALPMRFTRVYWGTDHLALVDGRHWAKRHEARWLLDPAVRGSLTLLYNRSAQDTYTDPGAPYLTPNAQGRDVLATNGRSDVVYLFGAGASAEGDRPFVDELNVRTRKTTRWWRSTAPFYEVPIAILDFHERYLLIRRESVTQAPNYYFRDAQSNRAVALTRFPHPYVGLAGLKKQVLHYQRPDGVVLTANLYLPPTYKKTDGPLPTLLEAYPVEFKDKKDAGQVKGSPYAFTRLSWGSPVYWVTQGYAVLQGASIPIVGEGDQQPNDTYVEQLVASAKAAIDEGQRLGVVDPKRVAVMGHSYGAFMTANLLAHSSLFRAGIARSGAYNRTLTPFGFQGEERTYWQAPEVYNAMSPFNYADKIRTPLLLLHGEADNNSGTFPLQSERFYSALKGHGATVRYVVLPAEAHGYVARESVLHMLWEMNAWLDKYVKTPPAAVGAAAPAPAPTAGN